MKEYTDEFGIEFSTKEMPGKVVATAVRIFKRVLSDDDSINVNLSGTSALPKACRIR